MSVLNRQIKMAALGVLLAASAVSAVRAPDVEREWHRSSGAWYSKGRTGGL